MQNEIPLALSDIPVFHEVAGETAVYFNKDDPKDIARKINYLIKNNVLQKRLTAKYNMQLDKFNWDKNVSELISNIDKILGNTNS